MQLNENIRLALSGLMSNKLRSFLTMLGIIIGIAAVIAIATVGNSMTKSITGSMESMGINAINVYLQPKMNEYDQGNGGGAMGGKEPYMNFGYSAEQEFFTYKDIKRLKKDLKDYVAQVSVQRYSSEQYTARDKRLYANINVIGVDEGYKDTDRVKMIRGRFISDRDKESERNVAVVSDKFVKSMFPGGKNVIGKEVNLYTENSTISTFIIIGVYKYIEMSYPGGGMGMGPRVIVSDNNIPTNFYIPVSVTEKNTPNRNNYQEFKVISKSGLDSNKVSEEIQKYFDKKYANNEKWQVTTDNMEQMINETKTMLDSNAVGISVIAAISLLVGGIGVMNIMLVSVTERTREIGVRKALGAKTGHIMTQFLVESVIVCLIGGAIGIGLGIAIGSVGASMLNYPAAPSIEMIFASVIVTMLIGVFFGFYPARKAARMDPIDALRYE